MKHKLLTLASAAALLAACSDTAVSDANDEIKEKGTVTFFVYDVLTRQPIEKAEVYYRTSGKTNKTDAKGGLVWKGVDIGTSYFDITHEGYADIRHTTYLDDQIKHDVARVDDNTEKIPMFELGVNVKGKLYYIDHETKDWKPASGVTVYVDYPDSSEIFPNEVYATTEEDGSYEFKNLAANVMFQVKSERFTVNDSIVYEVTSIDSVSQRKGVTEHTWKELDPMAAEVASLEPKLLSSNLSSVGVKDDLKLTFSEVLEKDSVTTKHINVKRIVTETPLTTKDVAVSLSLSEDGKTVTVKSNSGAWAEGKAYLINFDVWSKLAKELKDSVVIGGVEYKYFRKFIAGAPDVPGQVKGLMIKLDDDDDEIVSYSYLGNYTIESELDGKSDLTYNEQITIKWNAIEKNVNYYNVYVKGDNESDADYVLAGSNEVGAIPEDTAFTIDLAKVLNKNNFLAYPQSKKQSGTIDVIVLAENVAGEALAKDAKPLSIKIFEKVSKNVKEKQSNQFLEDASVEISTLYKCTGADDEVCAATVSKGTKFTGTHYKADLVIKGTVDGDYDGEYPTGYALYYNKSGDEWVKIAEQASSTFALAKTSDDSPFKSTTVEYDEGTSKKYKFAVVPFFDKKTVVTPGYCSDFSFPDEATCLAAYETWTPAVYDVEYTISQTDINAKNGVFIANDDLTTQITNWNK